VEEVISVLRKEGYRLVESTDDLSNIESKTMRIDQHILNILILPSNADFHDHQLLKDGHIILQDKASCFPAYILNPPLHARVIDACAAPGNKTSHLSAIMQNTGSIFAFDQDEKRLQTLVKLTGRAGCKSMYQVFLSFYTIS
jgi:25S rRNA (cytosine2278-C5)-methyltransferase